MFVGWEGGWGWGGRGGGHEGIPWRGFTLVVDLVCSSCTALIRGEVGWLPIGRFYKIHNWGSGISFLVKIKFLLKSKVKRSGFLLVHFCVGKVGKGEDDFLLE